MRLRLALAGAAALPVLLAPAAAWAHPLGNFTVNTADRIEVVADGVEVTHVVDLAEIPTVQLRESADTDRSSSLSASEITAYAGQECASVLPRLALVVDGSPAELALRSSTGEARPGQAGLSTTRVVCLFATSARPSSTVSFTDGAAVDRTGWREVTAVARCGTVESSDVPEESTSQLLLAYPEATLNSPPDISSASLRISRDGGCRASSGVAGVPGGEAAAPRGVDRLTSEFADFVGREDLGLLAGAAAVVLSLLFGALHALAPGHGKTVMAAYLVGTRGTKRQALMLGAFVTISHTASVLLLGLAINVGTLVAPERVVPVTEILSGVLLAAIGVWLLTSAVRRLRASPDHTHDDEHHDHPHDHDDEHDHPHGSGDHAGLTPATDHHIHGAHAHDDHDHDHPHEHDHPHPHPHPHDHDHPHEHGSGDHAGATPVSDHHIHGDRPQDVPGSGDHAGSAPHGDRHIPGGEVGAGPHGTAVATAPAPVVHSHGGRAHSHAPLDDRPLTWRSLATMGVASGLVPSPSVLVVLLGATALGRAPFGVLLVLGYGVGMAATLVAAGLLLLRAQGVAERRGWQLARTRRLGRVLPALTATVVILLGIGLAVRGFDTARTLF